MIQNQRSVPLRLDGAFDNFLYFLIDRNETTILSMLARLDNDPWHVAQQLVTMPRAKAICYMNQIVESGDREIPSYSTRELEAWIDLLPRYQRKQQVVSLIGGLSLTHLFFGFNAIFFILLCLSLIMPLPRRVDSHTGRVSSSSMKK